jgi:hypothetical protein
MSAIPVGLFSPRIKLWGCPWHGYVTSSQLRDSAGNLVRFTWTQPGAQVFNAGVDKCRDNCGWTLYQKMPGVAVITRTPAQLALDASLKHEWRNDFIVSGLGAGTLTPMRIYDLPAGGFIYAPTAASRWLIQLGKTFTWTVAGGLTLPLNPRRFGDFRAGQPAQDAIAYSITKTAADMGQAAAPASGYTLIARVVDILPDGSKAIIQLGALNNASTTELYATAAGYLLLELSGIPGEDFAATLTVLKDRAATVAEPSTVTNRTSSTPNWSFSTTSEVTHDDPGSFPTCDGNKRTDYHVEVAPTGGMDLDYELESRVQFINHVVSMYFDEDGDPQPIYYSSELSKIGYRRHTINISSADYYKVESYIPSFVSPAGVCILSGEIIEETYPAFEKTYEAELDWTVSESFTVDGATVGYSMVGHWYHKEHESAADNVTTVSPVEDENYITVDGNTYHNLWSPNGIEGGTDSWPDEYFFSTGISRNLIHEPTPGTLQVVSVGQRRYSNNLFGAYWYNRNSINTVVTGEVKAISRAGDVMTSNIAGFNFNIGQYGSWNPVTHEIKINSTSPMNWT